MIYPFQGKFKYKKYKVFVESGEAILARSFVQSLLTSLEKSRFKN